MSNDTKRTIEPFFSKYSNLPLLEQKRELELNLRALEYAIYSADKPTVGDALQKFGLISLDTTEQREITEDENERIHSMRSSGMKWGKVIKELDLSCNNYRYAHKKWCIEHNKQYIFSAESKVPESELPKVHEKYKAGISFKNIGRDYGLSRAQITRLYKNWCVKNNKPCDFKTKVTLTDTELLEVHKMRQKGLSFPKIAKEYEISRMPLTRRYKEWCAKNNIAEAKKEISQ